MVVIGLVHVIACYVNLFESKAQNVSSWSVNIVIALVATCSRNAKCGQITPSMSPLSMFRTVFSRLNACRRIIPPFCPDFRHRKNFV